MAYDFPSAVQRVSEVVMFENWLRFYFISEENDKLFIRLPDKTLERLKERYANLVGLAERLNGVEIDHQTSLSAVCLFVAYEIDGKVIPEALLNRVFDSVEFHLELQLFSTWVQAHEKQLDASFQEFSAWREMFEAWKKTDEVKQYLKDLMDTHVRTVHEGSETTQ